MSGANNGSQKKERVLIYRRAPLILSRYRRYQNNIQSPLNNALLTPPIFHILPQLQHLTGNRLTHPLINSPISQFYHDCIECP